MDYPVNDRQLIRDCTIGFKGISVTGGYVYRGEHAMLTEVRADRAQTGCESVLRG